MYARFGQELYPQETRTAAAILASSCGAEEPLEAGVLIGRIAEGLPHASPATRRRIAVKLLQRFAAASPSSASAEAAATPSSTQASAKLSQKRFEACRTEKAALIGTSAQNGAASYSQSVDRQVGNHRDAMHDGLASFARLIAYLPDTQARRELTFYAAAHADGLIGAIARDILYPYFIEGRIPPPYGEDEFIMANAGLLLAPEPILTAGFVADFASRTWNFDSERTVGLALRILRQAGILLSAPLLGTRGRVAAYTLAPHGLSLAALLWGLHQEFGHTGLAPAWDQVGRARFARLHVVPPSVIASRLWEAERAGLVGFWSAGGTKRVALKVREADALSRLLLSNPHAK